MAKAPIGIPIVASLAAFVLVLLALFSGMGHPIFLEQADIITFNTSELGKNLATKSSSSPSTTSSSFCDAFGKNRFGSACASATAAVASDVASVLDEIEGHVADELAETLGIRQFYSLHAMTICQGYFAPNATTDGASRNVTSCTRPFSGYNVSSVFDHELGIGPLKLNLVKLGFSDDIQKQLDSLYRAVEAFAIMLIIGAGFACLSFLASVAALFLLPGLERGVLLANVVLSGFAMGILTIAVTVATAASYLGASKTNEKGDDVGITAAAGRVFTAITWAAVGASIIAFLYWVVHHRRFRKGHSIVARSHRKSSRDSEESYSPPRAAPEPIMREPEMQQTVRQPAARRDRWGRFHEGVSWNSFPSRISFLSRQSRNRGGGFI